MSENLKKDNNYIEIVASMVKELKYGSVTLVIQDGKVIQIEQNKKIRI